MQNNENNKESNLDCFKVYVRIRPLSEKEIIATEKLYANTKLKNYPKSIIVKEDNLIFVLDPDKLEYNGRKERNFAFDNVYEDTDNNKYIFDSVGYNSTALAYGVTGTGKTHTIFGDMQKYLDYFEDQKLNEENYNESENSNENINKSEKKENNFFNQLDQKYEIGVCLHAVDYLFSEINKNSAKKFQVKISYLEIYNEQVRDLLVDSNQGLMIVEDAQKGVIVPDLNEMTVTDSSELIKLIIMGNSRRTMAPTGQNLFSSRSHAILQIQVEQHSKIRDVKEEYFSSKFLLVDLAGSERGGLEKGIRTHEGKNINKSLLSLGNCINLLSDATKKGCFVPYRDSKLTRLLKDSLGGNIKTAMIACISPSPTLYDETVNTLKYAMRARSIEKAVTKNVKEVEVHISQYRDIIDSLKNEIEQLKVVIKNQENIIQVTYVPNEKENNNKEIINITNNNFNSEIVDIEEVNFNSNVNSNLNSLRKENLTNKKKEEFNKKPKSSLSVRAFPANKDDDSENKGSITNKNKNEYIGISAGIKEKQGKQRSTSSLNEIKQFNLAGGLRKNTYSSLNMKSNLKQISKKTFDNINVNTNENNNKENLRKLTASPCSTNNKEFDISGYRSFLFNNSEEDELNMDELEAKIDNLNNDKNKIEDFLQKEKNNNKVNEKYKQIKSCYEKYLEYINEKLIQNIEESMIIKFNLKEILDLNQENKNNINSINSQIEEINKEINKPYFDDSLIVEEKQEKLKDLQEELKNIENNIEENNLLSKNITDSLKKNMRFKDYLKKILLKLISKNQIKKETSLEEAYSKIVKEKEELEKKNKNFEKHLSNIIQEKNLKENKLDKVQDEINKLKKIIQEKDKQIKNFSSAITNEKTEIKNKPIKNQYSNNILLQRGRDISKNEKNEKKINPSKSNEKALSNKLDFYKKISTKKVFEKEKNKSKIKNDISIGNNLYKKKDDKIFVENFTNLTLPSQNNYDENLTDVEKIEINLQDDYTGTKKKFIGDLNPLNAIRSFGDVKDNKFLEEDENKNVIKDNNIILNKDNYDNDNESNDNSKNNSSNKNIQNIKYIINQTNNIVNNNINKCIEKEKNKKNKEEISSFTNTGNSSKISFNKEKNNIMNLLSKPKNSNDFKSKLNKERNNSHQKHIKKNSTLSRNTVEDEKDKLLEKNLNLLNELKYNPSISNTNSNKNNLQNLSNCKSTKNSKVIFSTKKENEKISDDSKKLKEYDKIINNQLNNVYNKKAKEIGEKMKEKIKPKNSQSEKLSNLNCFKKQNNLVTGISSINNLKKENVNNENLVNSSNRSFSISCVSMNNEIGFYSELDIVDQLDVDNKLKRENKKLNKEKNPKEIGYKNLISYNNNYLNGKFTDSSKKKIKKITALRVERDFNNDLIKKSSKEIMVKRNEEKDKENNNEIVNVNTSESLRINKENLVKNVDTFDKSNISKKCIDNSNNFVNEFLNSKSKDNKYEKSYEKICNSNKNIYTNENKSPVSYSINEGEFNYEIDKVKDSKIPFAKKDKVSLNEKSEKSEKNKISLINPIPLIKSKDNFSIKNSNTNIKKISKVNNKENSLLNQQEIQDEINNCITNLQLNKNKYKEKFFDTKISDNNNNNNNSRNIGKINVQKFLNSNNNIISNTENNKISINKLACSTELTKKPSSKLSEENEINSENLISELLATKYINNKLKNNSNNTNHKKQKAERFNSLKEFDKNSNLKENLTDNKLPKDRSFSLLKQARLERKQNAFGSIKNKSKNKEILCIKDLDDLIENKNNKSNKNSQEKFRMQNSTQEKKSTKNYLRNYFNSYKKKKYDSSVNRKGSVISKNSMDFVNDYMLQKNSEQKSLKNFEVNSSENFEIEKNKEHSFSDFKKFDIKNEDFCDLNFEDENVEIYENKEDKEIKAIFLRRKNSEINEEINNSQDEENENYVSNFSEKNLDFFEDIGCKNQFVKNDGCYSKNKEGYLSVKRQNKEIPFEEEDEKYVEHDNDYINVEESLNELNADDLFKSFHDVKNPKFSKYLDNV